MSGARSRLRRSHLIVAGGVVLALVAGGVAWAAIGGGSGGSETAGADPASSEDTTAPADGPPAEPSAPDATAPEPDPTAGSPQAGGFPVPTWEPAGPGGWGGGDPRRDRGRDGPDGRSRDRDGRAPGLPSDLSAERDGDSIVLRWTDNTSNEDGFALFVTQGRTSFQIVVPADTTSYEGFTAARGDRVCFAVVPFTWTAPVPSYPIDGWECTGRRRP